MEEKNITENLPVFKQEHACDIHHTVRDTFEYFEINKQITTDKGDLVIPPTLSSSAFGKQLRFHRFTLISFCSRLKVVFLYCNYYFFALCRNLLLWFVNSKNICWSWTCCVFWNWPLPVQPLSNMTHWQGRLTTQKSHSACFKNSFSNVKLVSEVNCSKSSNICLICSCFSLKCLKDINKNATSTLWIIAKVSQKFQYDFLALVFLNM